jgi:integron integrase
MKLKQQLYEKIRTEGKDVKTADAYWGWIKRFLLYAQMKRGEWVHPKDMGRPQVEKFLTHLAVDQNVAPSTQNQALAGLCYLYNVLLEKPLENVNALRAKKPQIVRQVLDQSEIVLLFEQLRGPSQLAAKLMYASSFRIGEIGRIRMKDISFERCQINVQESKHGKSRVVGFPESLHEPVRRQVESVRVLWKHDVADGLNGVTLPYAWGKKSPSSHLNFAWWYLFTADNYCIDRESGISLRHHCDMGNIGRNISQAAIKAGIPKRITSHCLRHSWTTHSLEGNVPIHIVQALAGHSSMETTMGYAHLRKDAATATPSPLDALSHLLANPQIAIDRRKDNEQEPPELRIFAG